MQIVLMKPSAWNLQVSTSESWRKAWREKEVGSFSYGHATGNGLKRSMISTEMRFLVGTPFIQNTAMAKSIVWGAAEYLAT